MRIRETKERLQIEDTPGLHWVLGVVLIVPGALAVFSSTVFFADAADALTWKARIIAGLMGAGGVFAGLWWLAKAPRSRLVVERAAGKVHLGRTSLRGRFAREWPCEAVQGVRLVVDRDDEGGEVFQIELVFHDEEPMSLSPVWRHGRESIERIARRLAETLSVALIDPGATDPKIDARGA